MSKCDLCKFFEAEVTTVVEAAESGRQMEVDLCRECEQKGLDRRTDDSVSFETELRLRERSDSGGTSDR